jgi:hypothetical protein
VSGAALCTTLVWAGMRWPLQLTGIDPSLEEALESGRKVAVPMHQLQPFIELAKMVAALLIGALVTAIHQPVSRDRPRSIEQAQTLLCVSGAMMMIIIGNSLARAFGIAGAAGIVRFRTPVDDPATNPLSSGNPNFNFYTMEVVQRIGYDSYTPDSGVLLAKNKERPSAVGGSNSFTCFNWTIDAHPEDINKVDYTQPGTGKKIMRTVADYRQLNDALFHAGTRSGSQYEWEDTPNRLHFYVVDVQKSTQGVLSYTLGVRSLDGAGPQKRGVSLTGPSTSTDSRTRLARLPGDRRRNASKSPCFLTAADL